MEVYHLTSSTSNNASLVSHFQAVRPLQVQYIMGWPLVLAAKTRVDFTRLGSIPGQV